MIIVNAGETKLVKLKTLETVTVSNGAGTASVYFEDTLVTSTHTGTKTYGPFSTPGKVKLIATTGDISYSIKTLRNKATTSDSGVLGPVESLESLGLSFPASNNIGKEALIGTSAPYSRYISNGGSWLKIATVANEDENIYSPTGRWLGVINKAGDEQYASSQDVNGGLYQAASRCSQQNKANTTSKELMSRSRHVAMAKIDGLALVFWNGYTDFEGTGLETGGGAATYTASVEYPSGTIAAQIKWSGSVSKSAADLEVFRSDLAAVSIPKGDVFFVRVWRSSAVGIIYNKFGGLLDTEATTTYSGEGFTFGVTQADLTMTPGQFTNIGNTGTGFRPQAIVTYTTKPSLALVGDSRVNNDTQLDSVTDGFGLVGELERTFGMQYPCIKLSQSSERCYNAVNRYTYRRQLAAYCTHVISNYGVNDFRDSKTAAQTIAAQQALAALIGKPYYVCTVAPMANAGNTVTDATVNPLRIAYNAIIRKGDAAFAGTLEIADIVETARDSGLWISGYTSDGLHANTAGSLALARSGSLRLPL